MANRIMAAKALKLRKQNRKRPRTLSLDIKGPRPAREVIFEYRERAKSLGIPDFYDSTDLWWGSKGYPSTKIFTKSELVQKWDQPMFVEYEAEHFKALGQQIRLYFNSRQDKVVIRRVYWTRRCYCLSLTFGSIADAYYGLLHDCVPWKDEQPFPTKND